MAYKCEEHGKEHEPGCSECEQAVEWNQTDKIKPKMVGEEAECAEGCPRDTRREPPNCAKAADYTDGLCFPYYRARVSALEATVERVGKHRSQDAAEVRDIFGMNALIGDGSVELSREDAKRVLSILRAPVPAALAPQEKPDATS